MKKTIIRCLFAIVSFAFSGPSHAKTDTAQDVLHQCAAFFGILHSQIAGKDSNSPISPETAATWISEYSTWRAVGFEIPPEEDAQTFSFAAGTLLEAFEYSASQGDLSPRADVFIFRCSVLANRLIEFVGTEQMHYNIMLMQQDEYFRAALRVDEWVGLEELATRFDIYDPSHEAWGFALNYEKDDLNHKFYASIAIDAYNTWVEVGTPFPMKDVDTKDVISRHFE
ncbi:MAG: hypothetical protein AAF984_11100 [Verrucomicrobiota bacterium]